MFNVLLIVRAPLQLFQAIQTSILPHLAGLEARESPRSSTGRSGSRCSAIAAFAAAVAIGLLAIGPFVMTALLGDKGFPYGRFGLALVGLGMGLHLSAGHAQPGRARPRAARAGRRRWLLAAALFVVFMLLGVVADQVLRIELGYVGAAGLLARGADGALPPRSPTASASAT